MTPTEEKVSDQMITLIQVIFGFVLAQVFAVYGSLIIDPAADPISFAAIAAIFLTAVLSWIDWHTTMVETPYKFYQPFWRKAAEEGRVLTDLLVVSIYAFALQAVDRLKGGAGDATLLVWAYAGIFAAYVLSGLLRRYTYRKPALHGHPASYTSLLSIFTVAYVLLAFAYMWLHGHGASGLLNVITIAVVFGLMLAFRVIHAVQRPLPHSETSVGSV